MQNFAATEFCDQIDIYFDLWHEADNRMFFNTKQ